MMNESAIPSPGKNGRLLLYAGLAMGVVAAALVAMVMSQASGEKATEGTTRVAVVAAQDIPARTRLTSDVLKVGVFRLDDVDSEAYLRMSDVVNRVTSADIVAGQPISPAVVSQTSGTGLNFVITEGMRGISIEVEEVVATGGNISPGNYVDVIGVFDLDQNGSDAAGIASGLLGSEPSLPTIIAGGRSSMTLTLLQNVRVLAVDQTLQPQQADVPLKAQTKASASTVTLEVLPDKAQVLALADALGTLRLSVRPFGEITKVPVAPLSTGLE